MKRMRRLGAEGEEATFIVDMEFKRINPLLQMQNSMPSESWPLSPVRVPTSGTILFLTTATSRSEETPKSSLPPHRLDRHHFNMNPNYVYAFAVGIGVVAGLRSLTAPAAVSWAAHLGWLNLHSSPLAFMGSTVAVAIFSLLAIGELIADKMPKTPGLTSLVPLLARILVGGLCGASLCVSANQSLLIGALLGGTGAVIGAFGGYDIRRRLVSKLNTKDIFIAISEDLITIGLACFLVSR
jgi:uncharacterized membrane protein